MVEGREHAPQKSFQSRSSKTCFFRGILQQKINVSQLVSTLPAKIFNCGFKSRWGRCLVLPLACSYNPLTGHFDTQSFRYELKHWNRPLVALRGYVTNASFKQWVGISLMPKIDRVHKNYLIPEIWEEAHLREIFHGTFIFQQSSKICIGRQLVGQNYF